MEQAVHIYFSVQDIVLRDEVKDLKNGEHFVTKLDGNMVIFVKQSKYCAIIVRKIIYSFTKFIKNLQIIYF